MKDETKEKLRESGLFYGFFLLLIIIVLLATWWARPKWQDGLKTSVQTVLNERYPDSYIVGDFLLLKSPLSLSAAAFTVTSSKLAKQAPVVKADKNDKTAASKKTPKTYAMVVRATGYSGPMALVYLYSQDTITFAGIAGIKNSTANPFSYGLTEAIIEFWGKRLQKITILETEE